MSTIALWGDAHVHPHASSAEKLDACIDAVKWVYEECADRDIHTVVFLGDLFHSRNQINVYAYDIVHDIVRQGTTDKDIRSIMLVGNHDMFYRDKWSVTSLGPFREIADVIDKPITLNFDDGTQADALPYVRNPAGAIKEHFKGRKRPPILFGHCSVSGAVVNTLYGTKYVDTLVEEIEEIDPAAFKKYGQVLLGHFHARQTLGNISYVGSPLQLSFGEAMDDKGFTIIDTHTLKMEFVENKKSPKYLVLPYDQDLTKVDVKNAYVRFLSPPGMHHEEALSLKKDALAEHGARRVEVVEVRTDKDKDAGKAGEAELASAAEVTANIGEIISQFVEAAEVPLDKERLTSLGIEVVVATGQEMNFK